MRNIVNLILNFVVIVFIITGCSQKAQQVGHKNAQMLRPSETSKYALYAMMSSNVYLDSNRNYFPISELGWTRVDTEGNTINLSRLNSYQPKMFLGKIFSNLQYDIWEHNASNKTVIAFKGSDEKADWIIGNFILGISIPYKSAKKHVKKYIKNHPEREVILTGHSLGGGIALSVSLWVKEVKAAYVFNSSPRVFDGYKDHKKPAIRKAISQEKEFLSKIRASWPKFTEIMNEDDIYQTNFKYKGGENMIKNHRMDFLAEGLLRCSTNSPEFVEFAKKISQVNVSCSE